MSINTKVVLNVAELAGAAVVGALSATVMYPVAKEQLATRKSKKESKKALKAAAKDVTREDVEEAI